MGYKRGSLAMAKRIFNVPQLVVESDLQRISQYVVDRANSVDVTVINAVGQEEKTEKVKLAELVSMSGYDNEAQKARYHSQLGITNDGKRGNLFVEGVLVAKAGQIDADCMEILSYERLYHTFQLQVQEGIEELVIHVDSGGGEAFSCFEMAAQVQKDAHAKGISIKTFINGSACSAAYAWASIGDEVIARPQSDVGSIGVVVQLINNSKMLEDIGITRKFITYGDSKVPFDDEGQFTDKFIAGLQKKVDKVGLEFTTFVAKNRNMNVEDVVATQAEVFDAEEALALGLVDKVMTQADFFNNYLPSANANSNSQYQLQHENNMSKDNLPAPKADKDVTVEGLQASLDTANGTIASLNGEVETLKAQVEGQAKLQEEFDKLQASFDALQATAKEAELAARTADRTAKLSAALGADNPQVATMLASTDSLEAEQFDAIVEALGTTQESKQADLAEKGGEGKQAKSQSTAQERLLAANKKLGVK